MPGSPLKQWTVHAISFLFIACGSLLAAFALEVFFFPNNLIDGGITGLAMVCAYLVGKGLFPTFLLLFNLPFVVLAWRAIGRSFVVHMLFAILTFSLWSVLMHNYTSWEFHGETLEVVVIGGAILGSGLGLIIRFGGGIDGTEIMGIIINRRTGFTVGQVVLFSNIFVFTAAGIAFQDWHPPLLSLITYVVVIKIMDAVIVGLDETKSVLINTKHPDEIGKAIMHELGLGLTVMYGRGGFTGEERELLYVIVERLQLAELKDLVYRYDPGAFIAIENLHEVANGNQGEHGAGSDFTTFKQLGKSLSGLFKDKGKGPA